LKKKFLAVLAVFGIAAVAAATGGFHADVGVANDYLWYNASQIITINVDGVSHAPEADGTLDLPPLSNGTHHVSVEFQLGQDWNYVMTGNTCSGTFTGPTFSCGVGLTECPDGPGACGS
jgi:hypothetical protein